MLVGIFGDCSSNSFGVRMTPFAIQRSASAYKVLQRCDIVDTGSGGGLLTTSRSWLLSSPRRKSMITFIDRDRQGLKSKVGTTTGETSRITKWEQTSSQRSRTRRSAARKGRTLPRIAESGSAFNRRPWPLRCCPNVGGRGLHLPRGPQRGYLLISGNGIQSKLWKIRRMCAIPGMHIQFCSGQSRNHYVKH
jgi:hypothetical protein